MSNRQAYTRLLEAVERLQLFEDNELVQKDLQTTWSQQLSRRDAPTIFGVYLCETCLELFEPGEIDHVSQVSFYRQPHNRGSQEHWLLCKTPGTPLEEGSAEEVEHWLVESLDVSVYQQALFTARQACFPTATAESTRALRQAEERLANVQRFFEQHGLEERLSIDDGLQQEERAN